MTKNYVLVATSESPSWPRTAWMGSALLSTSHRIPGSCGFASRSSALAVTCPSLLTGRRFLLRMGYAIDARLDS